MEVCGSLWGEGNGDISGIGMVVGYILDHILGFSLSALVLHLASERYPRLTYISRKGLDAFAHCAIFFAFSLELAAIVVLVRADFGINTSGMGDYTVRITQAVAMVILLPLVYPLLTSIVAPVSTTLHEDIPSPRQRAAAEDGKDSARFSLIVACWALAFYPFYSKMNAAFGPSKLQNNHASGNSGITRKQFEVIQNICLENTDPVTYTEANWMTAFVMLAYIPLSLFVLGRIFWLIVQEQRLGPDLHQRLQNMGKKIPKRISQALPLVTFGSILLITCGLMWSIIRAQRAQAQLTISYGGFDSDNYWTFGQIVAVTIFAPVVVECWSSWSDLSNGVVELPNCALISSSKVEKAGDLGSVDPL